MSTFTHKGYRIEAESRKDTSARLGQAHFTVYRPDGGIAFFVDFEVSRLAAAHFWAGDDEEQIALREGKHKVQEIIDGGKFVVREKLILRALAPDPV